MDIMLKFKPTFTSDLIGILTRRTGVNNWNVTFNPGGYEVLKLNSVNNKSSTNAWKSEKCNEIRGNEGFFINPEKIWRKEEFFTFLTFFCYAFPLEFVEKVSLIV